jgi:hypothetical protein
VSFDARRIAHALTGAVDIRAFNEESRERHASRFEAAIDVEQLRQLFDLDRLESLLSSDRIPLDSIDLYQDGHLIRLSDVQKKSGRTALEIVIERFGSGATIRLRDVDAVDAPMRQFAAEVHRHFAAPSQVNLYLTPPGKDGFPPHFDITDVFIVQVLGAKEWRVFDDYSNRIDLPAMETNWEPDRFRPTVQPVAMTLRPGDALYLPRGVMHQAFCTGRASMHLTVSLAPLTYADLLVREVRRVAALDVTLRRRVPWTADGSDPASDRSVADTLRACLASIERHLDVPGALDAERGAVRREGEGAASTGTLAASTGWLFEGRDGRTSDAGQPQSAAQRSQPTEGA